MKFKYLFFLFLFYSCQSKPQNTSPLPLQLEDLKNCNFKYENLTSKGGPKEITKQYFYKKEKYTGCAIHFNKENKSYFVFDIKNGKLQRQICVYENGQLERDFNFKDGVSEGKHQMWYADGSPYIDETYKNGQPIKLLRWHNNKQLAREAIFENGEMVKEILYKKDGSIQK